LCTLEFEDHRPLYDWFLTELDTPAHPQQIEFSRLSLSYTVMSKRLLNQLVEQGHVDGWDDPRMPTLVGLHRRGYTPRAIRNFCNVIGITKSENNVDMAVLENCVREDLDRHAPRAMCVLRPLKLVIENYPEDASEEFDAPNHPADESKGTRKLPFARVIYIERDDFAEAPPRKFFRLAPGREVRLRYAYYVTCIDVVKDPVSGEVVEVRCTYDPQTRGGWSHDGRKVKGTLHWASAAHALGAEVRLYDRLFTVANPAAAESLQASLNPHSIETLRECLVEPSVAGAAPETRYQFERLGYFCFDQTSTAQRLVFNRTTSLRDSWAKLNKR
jgi:glutaminyl-tRNA synthetase